MLLTVVAFTHDFVVCCYTSCGSYTYEIFTNNYYRLINLERSGIMHMSVDSILVWYTDF